MLSIFAIALSSPVTQSSTVWCVTSTTLKGESVSANVLLTDFEKGPIWNPSSTPPLSIEKAIQKAKEYAQGFSNPDFKMEVGDVVLKNIGISHYVYVVEFTFISASGNSDGFAPPLKIVVLMDGTVIKLSKIQNK